MQISAEHIKTPMLNTVLKGLLKALPKALIFFAIIFNALICPSFADEIKITDLKFDNSDNIVLINSTGVIDNNKTNADGSINYGFNEIKSGFLTDPNRAYVDISNAKLAGPKKTYELKNSIFKTVKISQFSTNPNVVRLVFEYNPPNTKNASFTVISNNKAIAVKYTYKLNTAKKNNIVYSNTEDAKRIVFFENTTAEVTEDTLSKAPVTSISNTGSNANEMNLIFEKNNQKTANSKEYKLQSKFYVHSVNKVSNGIMVKGTGFVSLKPAFYLDNPKRMVIDLDDTVLSPSLRNKTFTINTPAPVPGNNYDEAGKLKQGETLKMGQNSTNVTRLVIQGPDAGNYRAVISPDLQNIFIAKRSDVINSKITETISTLKNIAPLDIQGAKGAEFNFTNPIAFSVFEENKNLYLDFNNVQGTTEGAENALITTLTKIFPEAKTVKIALDKLRIAIPVSDDSKNIQVKVSADSKTLQAIFKDETKGPEEEIKESDEKGSVISKLIKKGPSISNLYKVVIDAGHGGSDVGATRAGVYEKNITLSIAKMVEKNLKAKGVQTEMTLDRDKTVSLQERCDISNNFEPDVFVSIHVNSSVNDAIYGVETHWWKQDSTTYAKTVHANLSKNFSKWKTKDRGLFQSKFYVINHTEAPAILVEIGFISNTAEREALNTEKRQSEIAKAVSDGVMEYLKNRGTNK